MQNADNTDQVMKLSNNHKPFPAKIDRQLADDFRVISIALGQSQKKFLEDWKTRFVLDFKRGVLS